MAIVLRPHGKLDLKEAVKLKQKMQDVAQTIDVESHQFWILDLGKVSDLDHFGAIALLEVRRYVEQLGHQLFLSNASNTVKSVLKIAHISQEFEFLERNECLSAVGKDRAAQAVNLPTPQSQKVAQFPLPASPHSRRLYNTLVSLKSKLIERSADWPISV